MRAKTDAAAKTSILLIRQTTIPTSLRDAHTTCLSGAFKSRFQAHKNIQTKVGNRNQASSCFERIFVHIRAKLALKIALPFWSARVLLVLHLLDEVCFHRKSFAVCLCDSFDNVRVVDAHAGLGPASRLVLCIDGSFVPLTCC